MSTEKELMKLVADYGKECICAGIAELNANDAVKQRMRDDVRKSHEALTARLRALLAELEAEREDAARYQWLRNQHWHESPMCVVTQPNKSIKPGFDCPSVDRLDEAIDAARKGDA